MSYTQGHLRSFFWFVYSDCIYSTPVRPPCKPAVQTVQIPRFPEANHPLIQPLAQRSDQDLLTLFQRYPDQGRYFAALLCRYTPMVYTLIWHSTRSAVQADYLFALTWRHLFYEMGGLDVGEMSQAGGGKTTLQNWLINTTAQCINRINLPPVEEIQYSIQAAPPPLWCYVEQALEMLPPRQRLITIMAQTYHWSETRIAAYLQAEGESFSPSEIRSALQEAYQHLETALPADLRAIYFDDPLPETAGSATEPDLAGEYAAGAKAGTLGDIAKLLG